MSQETRHASAAYIFQDGDGRIISRGNAEAVIADDGLTIGAVTVKFLDADTLRAEDYRIDIGCWPAGTLSLNQLGRRFDTFTAELRRTRNQARVAGLLAHGVAMPAVFPAAVLGLSSARPVECQVYDTHITLVPEDADPWQVPLGALTGVEIIDEPPAVVLVSTAGRTVLGLLARRRDEFYRAVTERRQAQAALLRSLTGTQLFADGLGIERVRIPGFDALLQRLTAPGRVAGSVTLLGAARGGEPRFGLVQLLDPDAAAEAPPELPQHWASFLLVPVGSLTLLELLAGPSAATYLFEAGIEDVNRDLQQLHFRRAGLALQGADAELLPGNSYRLALRKLEPLLRLRAATRARLIHGDDWAGRLAEALGKQ